MDTKHHLLFILAGAGDQKQSLAHAKQALY
jgi:hypothetical protein